MRLSALLVAALACAVAAPAAAQSYLAKPQVVGGNTGPAHNYICPSGDVSGALDCYLDAVLHLYTMCRHVKSIEIIEHGYDKSDEGTNTAKSESCIAKQKQNIARPYQSALREVNASKPAGEELRGLHELWLGALASLKWKAGESDEDYKVRTGIVYSDFAHRADSIREHVMVMRANAASKQAVRQAKAAPAKDKGSR